MRKQIQDEIPTKAKKREIKKRPRMSMHGVSLRSPVPHGGKLLAKKRKK